MSPDGTQGIRAD